MDFLINRTNILDALTNKNPQTMENLGNLGRLLVALIKDCGISPEDHYITQLNSQIMFDEIFAKVIGNANTFLMKCLTGESGRGQHMCKENELIFAHITYDDFPEAYEGVEKEYMFDFGNILVENGFKEITEDLKHIRNIIDFDIENTRSFIYTVNKFGREFGPVFDQIIQYNMDLNYAEEQREEEERDMNPDHFMDNPDVGYKYHVSYTFNKPREHGLQIASQIIRIGSGPINTVEAVEALREYIESTIDNIVEGSLTILAFSYMGIERYEEPEEEEDNTEGIYGEPPADYFFDEEDGDHPAVEPVNKQKEEEVPDMRTFKIHYTTSETDFKEMQSSIIPTTPDIDLTTAPDEKLVEILSGYENIPDDIGVSISGVEEIKVAMGELPFTLKADGEDDIEKHED